VRALIDTHILLWWLAADPRLPRAAEAAIAEPETLVMVSAATAWEIAIKRALGRLKTPEDLLGALEQNDFASLPITVVHALGAGGLPNHHSDPFDRILIAQARSEVLTLISLDSRFADYDVDLLPLD
jgi:PIN domain nuclease of toxin-antitoxin system